MLLPKTIEEAGDVVTIEGWKAIVFAPLFQSLAHGGRELFLGWEDFVLQGAFGDDL